MIRIIVVDDHQLVRIGTRRLLEDIPGIEIVGDAGSGEEAVELVREHKPDVVVMDIRMPGIGGLAATRKIRRLASDIRILVLTAFIEEAFAQRLLEAGAQIGTLSLLRTTIGGTLDASGARFAGQFDADGTEIGLDLLMRHGGVYQRVDLLGVKVARRLSVSGSRFEGLLNADRIEVGESAFFREGAEFQRVDLLGARIGGQLSASGSTFYGLYSESLKTRDLVG